MASLMRTRGWTDPFGISNPETAIINFAHSILRARPAGLKSRQRGIGMGIIMAYGKKPKREKHSTSETQTVLE